MTHMLVSGNKIGLDQLKFNFLVDQNCINCYFRHPVYGILLMYLMPFNFFYFLLKSNKILHVYWHPLCGVKPKVFFKLYTRFASNCIFFPISPKNHVFCDKAFCWKIKITNQEFFCCETLKRGPVNKMTSKKISLSHFLANTKILKRAIEKSAFFIRGTLQFRTSFRRKNLLN